MSKYIFNCKAIGIAPETRWGTYDREFTEVITASSIEKALKKISKELATNRQFKFEYTYTGKD